MTICDTIRYINVRSKADEQLNLVHGPETKNKEKNKSKNRAAQKKLSRQ